MNEKREGLVEQPAERPQKIETVYTRPNGKQETIEFDFEKEIADFIDFYKKTGIELPENFEGEIRDIWDRNIKQIQDEIEKNGFDQILLLPTDTRASTLVHTLYEDKTYRIVADNILFDHSEKKEKSRIVLTYKARNIGDRPELASTFNTPGKDTDPSKALSLQDYLIFGKKYFYETGQHLDEEDEKTPEQAGSTWLSDRVSVKLPDDPDKINYIINAYYETNVKHYKESSYIKLTLIKPEHQWKSIGVRLARTFL